jgi:hypothetical protein
MVPTRELAKQISEVFNEIGKRTSVRAYGLFGGVEQEQQIRTLNNGVDVLVTTPGRMFDLIAQGFIDVSKLDFLVLDEADLMLDLGFNKDIKDVMKHIPSKRQTLFFTATISRKIKNLAYDVVRDAIRIQISPKNPVAKNIDHAVAFVEMDDKRFFLENILKEYEDKVKVILEDYGKVASNLSKGLVIFKKKVEEDPNHPLYNNFILNSIRLEEGNIGKVDNLYLVNKTGKSYDQNLLIYGFRQLKDGMGESNKDLYGKLIRLAILQSGLSNSRISFTTLLPYEDFETIYNDTLFNLGNLTNLKKYYEVGAFQRNNATNDNIVPFVKNKLRQSKKNKSRWFYPSTDFINNSLVAGMNKGIIPKVINISLYGKEGVNDYITFQWELPITKAEREKRRRNGNRNHIKRGLFKKVYTIDANGNRTPLMQKSIYNGVEYLNFVYKHINAWGDSFRANEFYDEETFSQLDNGFEKVVRRIADNKAESAEVEDAVIANILNKVQPKEETKEEELQEPCNGGASI